MVPQEAHYAPGRLSTRLKHQGMPNPPPFAAPCLGFPRHSLPLMWRGQYQGDAGTMGLVPTTLWLHPSPWPARAMLQLWDPRGVPRRCSPVQATAAPASREQRPRTVIMDDVRPGHNQGG